MQLSILYSALAYKSLIHRVNFGQFKLSTDIEKQKTLLCLGKMRDNNVLQIVCALALIYSKIRRITSVDDMIQIMTVGNQLYSSLSLLVRQSMLMLTELQEMFTVFERFFQLE